MDKADREGWSGIIAIVAILLITGFIGGALYERASMRRKAIEAGAGGYDQKTGDFVFLHRFEGDDDE